MEQVNFEKAIEIKGEIQKSEKELEKTEGVWMKWKMSNRRQIHLSAYKVSKSGHSQEPWNANVNISDNTIERALSNEIVAIQSRLNKLKEEFKQL